MCSVLLCIQQVPTLDLYQFAVGNDSSRNWFQFTMQFRIGISAKNANLHSNKFYNCVLCYAADCICIKYNGEFWSLRATGPDYRDLGLELFFFSSVQFELQIVHGIGKRVNNMHLRK